MKMRPRKLQIERQEIIRNLRKFEEAMARKDKVVMFSAVCGIREACARISEEIGGLSR